MSTEDPAQTVMRLLQTELRVVLDSGGLASINVSEEYPQSDALKACDGQVTVALSDTSEQKIDLGGILRRNTAMLRVNVWATDKSGNNETGKTLRNKIAAAVNLVIRQNRLKPNQTTYTYVGLGANSASHKASYGLSEVAPSGEWTELSAADYAKLWGSDENRFQTTASESGEYAVMLFGFKLGSQPSVTQSLIFCFEGYGSAPAAGGVTVKAWNQAAGEWQHAQSNDESQSDVQLFLALSSGVSDFVDEAGYIWFLAATNGSSDGETPAVLNCDYASLIASVNGITYCEVVGYRNLDRIDLKPPIYRTEFTLKSWFIQNIGE